MYASVRTYRSDPTQMNDMLHVVDEEFASKLRDEPGFCAYQVIDCGDGALVTVTCFRDREGATRSADLAASFIRDRLPDWDIERTDARVGEIRISSAVEQVLEPAHV